LDKGIENIHVELWEPMPEYMATRTIASFYMSTWDDPIHPDAWFYEDMALIAQDAMSGKVLPNTLESIPVTFAISGISRATTHQLVRTRVGAVFGQQGGRDNNWSNFNLRLPETWWDHDKLVKEAQTLQAYQNRLYQRAIAWGIPFQDARYVLPMGLETALVASYNLLSFKSLADRRLCNRMMWETNYVVRLMTDLVVRQYPFVGRNLRSGCERRGVCGSVSPMFPPSCATINKEGMVTTAEDNQTLKDTAAGIYDFSLDDNGCYRHFRSQDTHRMIHEKNHEDVVMSLVDWEHQLINKENNLWQQS
jgi:thymidylate synthase ThyX